MTIAGILLVVLQTLIIAKADTSVSKSTGPPSFFLQDVSDGSCLAGAIFKRCSYDTLWFVTGKPGSYSIHKRPADEGDDDVCLDRAQCHLEDSEVTLSNCDHCGAKKWNILGEADTGTTKIAKCSSV
jgi:hypothetical protein